MRRARLGDLYAVKVPNGYKLYQWAYDIPRKGTYIRVFNNLYDVIPEKLELIVESPHSYIIGFYASKAYRIGLAQFLGNFSVPEEYPFPKFQIRFEFHGETGKVSRIHVMNSDGKRDVWQWYDVNRVKDLPEEYKNVTLLNSAPTPNWLLYLFDNGFDLQHPEKFRLGDQPEITLAPYSRIVDSFLNRTGDSLKPLKK